MTDEGTAPGRGAAGVALVAGGLAVAIGGGGTALAFLLVSGTWPDAVQLALFSAPATLGALLGIPSVIAGVVAARRAGLGPTGAVGLLGAAAGALAVVGAAGWLLFLAAITALSQVAWH